MWGVKEEESVIARISKLLYIYGSNKDSKYYKICPLEISVVTAKQAPPNVPSDGGKVGKFLGPLEASLIVQSPGYKSPANCCSVFHRMK